jgi:hypothetical protein
MLKLPLSTAVIALSAFALTACDVKKTQEGNVTVPKYEVEKKQAGDVTVPKYEVTPPDVKVGTAEKKVDVPTVKTEEKTIEVPTVKVTPAPDK